jgi:ABC-type multidrug transport system fused ATPase/permease subunit
MTVLIIAHRLTTVRHCDVIHLIDGGRIVASGRYDDLIRNNATFRAMARAAE